MNAKHTSGPWEWGNPFGHSTMLYAPRSGTLVVAGEEPCFAVCTERDKGGILSKHPDATLIAAAPALLEALREMMDAVGWELPRKQPLRSAVAKAVAAIAKAEGRG